VSQKENQRTQEVSELIRVLSEEFLRQDRGAVDLSRNEDWTELRVFEPIDVREVALALLSRGS
jgi:hypothetical protein